MVEVCITKELDLACLAETGVVFDQLLSLRPEHVVVDLSGCRHIDAAGIGLLLDVHRRLTRRRAVLSVRDPNPRIRRILQTARLDEVLTLILAPRRAVAVGSAATRTASAARGRASVTIGQ